MCQSIKKNECWPTDDKGFSTVKCQKCGLVFIENPLDSDSMSKFYKEYYSKVHQANDLLNDKREIMYDLEIDFLKKHKSNGLVLDVGCSGGQFMDRLKRSGFSVEGVEYGEGAYRAASKNHIVYHGLFPKLEFTKTYDIIVFRGVIEHVLNPTEYLNRAISLLSSNGIIFITATPNRESMTFKIFNKDWNMHYPEEHIIHFSVDDFVNYFSKKGLKYYIENNMYTETPYCNFSRDINQIADKINNPDKNVVCPPFFDNMMTVVFKF